MENDKPNLDDLQREVLERQLAELKQNEKDEIERLRARAARETARLRRIYG